MASHDETLPFDRFRPWKSSLIRRVGVATAFAFRLASFHLLRPIQPPELPGAPAYPRLFPIRRYSVAPLCWFPVRFWAPTPSAGANELTDMEFQLCELSRVYTATDEISLQSGKSGLEFAVADIEPAARPRSKMTFVRVQSDRFRPEGI